jgi:hypothetical protein
MLKFIRRMFANLTTEKETKAPYKRTPQFMAQVSDNLERHLGMKLERPRNQHVPILRPDQLNHDLAAMHQGRIRNSRLIDSNTKSLQ